MVPARKPPALRAGDTVAVVSPSWGGPHVHPHVFEAGLATVTRELGLHVREYPTTRLDPDELLADPQGRARDLAEALHDPEVRAVVASIGGEDSLRVLEHLDLRDLPATPKVVMGFSDTTTVLLALRQAGWVTFHGPSVMAGLAQAPSFPPSFLEQLRAVLFEGRAHRYEPFPWYCQGYPDWSKGPEHAAAVGTKYYGPGTPKVLQGKGKARGEVLGGCFDVMLTLLGTPTFPPPEAWDDKILLLETSEACPSPDMVRRFLWNLEAQGIMARLAGILVGRPRDYRPDQRAQLHDHLRQVAAQCDRPGLPIMVDFDVGHTDPQVVLPLGVPLELDLAGASVRLCEPAVATSA